MLTEKQLDELIARGNFGHECDGRKSGMVSSDVQFDAIELLRKFMEYRDSDYVPNVLFDRARLIVDRAISSVSAPMVSGGRSTPVYLTVEQSHRFFALLDAHDKPNDALQHAMERFRNNKIGNRN